MRILTCLTDNVNLFILQRIFVNCSSNGGNLTSRTASAFQDIITTSLPIPKVMITVLGGTRQNAENKVTLQGSVSESITTNISVKWSCVTNNFDLSDRRNLRSESTAFNLVIAPNALAAGLKYVFKLSVSTIESGITAIGESTVGITVNPAPGFGSCMSLPVSGVALTTSFRLSCLNWNDKDPPLQYKFQTVSGTVSDTVTIVEQWNQTNNITNLLGTSVVYIDLCDFRLLGSLETKLPGRDMSTARDIDKQKTLIRATIQDTLGAKSHYFFAVDVFQPSKLDMNEKSNQIEESKEAGDLQSYTVLFAGTASYLNSVSATLRIYIWIQLFKHYFALQDQGIAQLNTSTASKVRGNLLSSLRSLAEESAGAEATMASLVQAATNFQRLQCHSKLAFELFEA